MPTTTTLDRLRHEADSLRRYDSVFRTEVCESDDEYCLRVRCWRTDAQMGEIREAVERDGWRHHESGSDVLGYWADFVRPIN